ncbi:hypothetical protein CDAR_392561, partial [Caerostris darwini]
LPYFGIGKNDAAYQQVAAQAHHHQDRVACDDDGLRVGTEDLVIGEVLLQHVQGLGEAEVEGEVEFGAIHGEHEAGHGVLLVDL